MPAKLQRRVTLSAGEECTITANGPVRVTLLTGAVDAAGCMLELSQPQVFDLSTGSRSLVLYTLEGGSANVASDSPVGVHKAATGAATLVQLVRRTLLTPDSGPTVKVLVIGHHRGGKTLAAHTLVNLLRRYGEEAGGSGALGDAGGAAGASRVWLLDLNAESNALYAPGCVAALEITPEVGPLRLGDTAAPTLLPLVFYTGSASLPTSKDIGSFIHFSEQLHDTVVAVQREQQRSEGDEGSMESSGFGQRRRQRFFTVVDAPSPQADLKEGVFNKKLIEIVKPTHVVVVGDREKMQSGDDWCSYLQEDVQRFLPECEFAFVDPCKRPCPQAPRELLFQEYFIGTPRIPLGCSKVVVAAQILHFVTLDGCEGHDGAALSVRRATPVKNWKGLVCALSHAETMEEVPLAPVAGLMLVSSVDEENNEVVLIVPASQEEALQRRFVIVPNGEGFESTRVGDTHTAAIEESVVV